MNWIIELNADLNEIKSEVLIMSNKNQKFKIQIIFKRFIDT
jgi:hypothetical protein